MSGRAPHGVKPAEGRAIGIQHLSPGVCVETTQGQIQIGRATERHIKSRVGRRGEWFQPIRMFMQARVLAALGVGVVVVQSARERTAWQLEAELHFGNRFPTIDQAMAREFKLRVGEDV